MKGFFLVQKNISLEHFLSTQITSGNRTDAVNVAKGVLRCEVVFSTETILYSLFMIALLLASVFGNLVVVMAIFLSKSLRKRATMHFIVSLAFSDLILSCALIPWKILINDGKFCYGLTGCYIYLISDVIGNVASILGLLIIAIDRFVAITFPFHYSHLISATRAKLLVLTIWIFAVLWSIVGLFKWDNTVQLSISISSDNICANQNVKYYASSFFGIYITSLLIMTHTYINILHITKRHINAIEDATPNIQKEMSSKEQITKEKRKKKFKRELKATKSVAIVFTAFLICWLPSCVVNIIIMVNKNIFKDLKKTNRTFFDFIFYFCIQILPSMNTMVNPIIYSFSNQQFLIAFKQLINKIKISKKLKIRISKEVKITERRSTQETLTSL
uniref:Alpha-1A adrenergic receptor n=1 Tax=Hydra vulgaris TaxID=6087 RepID=T2MG48_HYDVU